eukprot:TRINITY_DN1398_c0_g1_i2.p1 TRINITY_DN1398_c0_g1~~TRINITY_DN1398_c0_g1_i2.p1  ORF type:complete len:741 (-),score=152.37 TRINITY_DN1398_c0_g1_i2:114-2336(-)
MSGADISDADVSSGFSEVDLDEPNTVDVESPKKRRRSFLTKLKNLGGGARGANRGAETQEPIEEAGEDQDDEDGLDQEELEELQGVRCDSPVIRPLKPKSARGHRSGSDSGRHRDANSSRSSSNTVPKRTSGASPTKSTVTAPLPPPRRSKIEATPTVGTPTRKATITGAGPVIKQHIPTPSPKAKMTSPSPKVATADSAPSLWSSLIGSSSKITSMFAPATETDSSSASSITRQSNLPTKTAEEEAKHRREFDQMLSSYKHKLEEEAKDKRRWEAAQLVREKKQRENAHQWRTSDILAQWATRKRERGVRALVWQGVPASVRPRVWKKMIGNELQITPEVFEIFGAQGAAARRVRQLEEAALNRKYKYLNVTKDKTPKEEEATSTTEPESPGAVRASNGTNDSGAGGKDDDEDEDRTRSNKSEGDAATVSPSAVRLTRSMSSGNNTAGDTTATSATATSTTSTTSTTTASSTTTATPPLTSSKSTPSSSGHARTKSADAIHLTSETTSMPGKVGTVCQIPLDLARTYPNLQIFRSDGPFYEQLQEILEAYVCYRPDIGYVQGMSYLAAMLLLYLEPYHAFEALSNVLCKPFLLSFYRMDTDDIHRYCRMHDIAMEEQIPDLYRHFQNLGIRTEFYLIEWVLTLYSKSLPMDIASCVWDLYFTYGEPFVIRTALGILVYFKDEFMQSQTDDFVLQLLTHIPQDIDCDLFLRGVRTIKLTQPDLDTLYEKTEPSKDIVADM